MTGQPPQQATTRTQPNPTKYYNNWNMCCSCGFDVPSWHTSATCPYKRQGHRTDCTRQNYTQLQQQGVQVCLKGAHKNVLPTNPQGNQIM